MTSAELACQAVCRRGDLDHLAADLEEAPQLIDVARPCHRVAQEVTRDEQLAGEGVGFAFDLPVRPMRRVQEVVAEFVRDREALAPGGLGANDFDPLVDQPCAETAEAVDFDDLKSDTPSDRVHGHCRLRDVVLDDHAPSHVASVRGMRLLLASRTSRDCQQLLPLVFVDLDGHSRGSALRTLIVEAGRRREADPALLLGAAQIRHNQAETDYRALRVHLIEGRRNPAAALISLCRRRFGDARTVQGATMDKKERKVFAEVNRLRGDQGLGEKLDRYRQSREQYERLLKGRQESGPAIPLQRSQRETSAQGRIRGIVDGTR
jgi:hypothetical protein